jgi:hypothetical protein
MRKNLVPTALCLFLVLGVVSSPGMAAAEGILGKWLVKAETPNGPMELEFDFQQNGNQLAGTAALTQGVFPLGAIKFEDSKLSMELQLGDNSYRLLGALAADRFTGTWEQIGGDLRGTWMAERKATVGAVAGATSGITGSWDTISVTQNGELALTLDLRQEGENISGTLSSEMGTVPIQGASLKDNKFQFAVELGGTVYRVEGTLRENKIEGKWYPAAGGDGGEWRATRKAASPASAAVPSSAPAPVTIEGAWNAIAVTPDGELPFQMVFKQAEGALTAQIVTPDGTLPVQKLGFSDNKLSFEVDYMGGTYRIEALLTNGKFGGKWSAVSGSDSGAWSATRKP